MSIETLTYSNGEVSIIWQPRLCIHSGRCVKGLPLVFNPSRKPWIDASQAPTHELIRQVNQCPSGALSWKENNKTTANGND
jgi:uncharacterized Fe-S cluster protein YjdI